MSPRRSWFTKLELCTIPIRVANHVVYSEGMGSVVLEPADKSLHPVLLSRVLYVLALQNNLLSDLHPVANHRIRIEIEGKEMVFLQSGERRFTAAIRNNTAHRDPFPQRASHRATSFLERIHSDLHQLPVLPSSGFRYLLLFINDYSRYFWVYLLRKKSEMFDAFTQFKAMVEKQFDKSTLCLHDDKGGEFIGIKWDAFFAQHGIRRTHTVKALPQQNGVAERLNRTLEELLVATLNGAHLPAHFWGEGLNYLRHVIVCSPSSSIPAGTTPYEMAHKRKPDYSPLRVFGCRAWVHIQRKKRKSLQDHAKPYVFLGCPEDYKGWKL
jgi:transposase InsO family protein